MKVSNQRKNNNRIAYIYNRNSNSFEYNNINHLKEN